jgi:hypothetical protein
LVNSEQKQRQRTRQQQRKRQVSADAVFGQKVRSAAQQRRRDEAYQLAFGESESQFRADLGQILSVLYVGYNFIDRKNFSYKIIYFPIIPASPLFKNRGAMKKSPC